MTRPGPRLDSGQYRDRKVGGLTKRQRVILTALANGGRCWFTLGFLSATLKFPDGRTENTNQQGCKIMAGQGWVRITDTDGGRDVTITRAGRKMIHGCR